MKLSIVLLVVLMSGCASNPIKQYWTPTDAQWESASKSGTWAQLSNGQRHSIYQSHARNLYKAWLDVTKQSGQIATLALAESDLINAFATSDKTGKLLVIITFPLLTEIGNEPDALAAVIGHEMAHITYSHGHVRSAREQNAGVARNVIGTALNLAGVPMGGTVANLGVQAVTSAYSRDEEREADIKGIEWAVAAGYSACGGAILIRTFQKNSGLNIPFLSTHPGHEERISRASQIAGRPC